MDTTWRAGLQPGWQSYASSRWLQWSTGQKYQRWVCLKEASITGHHQLGFLGWPFSIQSGGNPSRRVDRVRYHPASIRDDDSDGWRRSTFLQGHVVSEAILDAA